MEHYKITDDAEFSRLFVRMRRKVTKISDTLKGDNLSIKGYWPQRFPCIVWIHSNGDLLTTYP